MRHRPLPISRFSSLFFRLAAWGLGFLVLLRPAAHAQSPPADSATAAPVGRLVYFEGTVGIHVEGDWGPARIDQVLRPGARLGTGPDATAKIRWADGGQSTLGPADTQRVRDLYPRRVTAPSESPSLLERFRTLFTERTAADEPAAVRRGPGTPFEQAARLYRARRFRNAIPAFRQALAPDTTAQGPALEPAQAALARFALAHCYLDTGQPEQARKALRALLDQHPESRPAAMARTLLAQL